MLTCQSLLAIQEHAAAAGGDLSRLLATVVDQASIAFPRATGAVVELLNGSVLTYAAASGPSAAFIGLSVNLVGSFSGSCCLTAEPARCDDAETDPRVDSEACRRVGIRSMVAVPLFEGKAVRGVLKIYSQSPAAFDDSDVLSARLLASPIAYGLSQFAAQEAGRWFQATFEQAAVGIAHVSPNGTFLRVNDRFCAITGHTADDLVQGGFQQITHPDDLEADLDQLAKLIDGHKQSYSMEKRYLHPVAGIVWVNLTVSLVRTQANDPEFLVAVVEDISARKMAEDLVSVDSLTGLPNRRNIENLIDQILETREPSSSSAIVAFLDIDNFKVVNDNFGHTEGDRCLRSVSKILQKNLRRGDIVGRLGGDEFVIITRNSTRREGADLLARLDTHVRKLGADHNWPISLSAGGVEIDQDSQISREGLLRCADTLMYTAKRSWHAAPRSRKLGFMSESAQREFLILGSNELEGLPCSTGRIHEIVLAA